MAWGQGGAYRWQRSRERRIVTTMHRKLALILAHWHDAALGATAALLEAERGRFTPWLPVFMAAGVVLYFSLHAEPAWWPAALALAGAVAGMWLSRGRAVLPAACWVLAAAALGFVAAQLHAAAAPPLLDAPSRAPFVSGTVRAVGALPLGRRVTLDQADFDAGPALGGTVR